MTITGINARTKVFIGLAFTYIISVNVPAVKEKVIPLLANHPHWSTTVGGVLFIVSLIQNPAVREALGIKTEQLVQETPDGQTKLTQTTSVVPVDATTTVEGTMTTTKTASTE